MYLIDTLYYIYKPVKRKDLFSISKKIAKENHTVRLKVLMDMILCSLIYGCMWTEYGDLDFYHRSHKNRKTFITTFYNFRLYDKVNLKSKRIIFHNKLFFLQTFKDFIKRDWININEESEENIKKFLMRHQNIVAKQSHGDSGKEVEVINVSEFKNSDDLLQYIHVHRYDLLEEKLMNHVALDKLNPTSLNTVRIVSVKNKNKVNILFAGIRVGQEGAKIDNISQGGKVARIDISSGKINSRFFTKSSSYIKSTENNSEKNLSGYQLPYWTDVISAVKQAASIVSEISIVAWDVAITNKGIDFIEGNESFGSVIMQIYSEHDEEGLKPKLLKML